MAHYVNGHRIEFFSHGTIAVDGKTISLGIEGKRGGHYTYARDEPRDATAGLAGRRLTGPGRPVGSYEGELAAEIVAALFPTS